MMTSTSPTSKEAVVKTLASRGELTVAEIAAATGLGRSTIGKTLAALERAGMARRSPGGREGGRPVPDRWALGTQHEQPPGRLRPGELDGLVLEFVRSHDNDTPLGVAAVAQALGRSAGAVGNCLARLAMAGQLKQVSEHPRRYGNPTPPRKRRGARRSRKDNS
jgi:DNA-binding IclR family transcriptional regulator